MFKRHNYTQFTVYFLTRLTQALGSPWRTSNTPAQQQYHLSVCHNTSFSCWQTCAAIYKKRLSLPYTCLTGDWSRPWHSCRWGWGSASRSLELQQLTCSGKGCIKFVIWEIMIGQLTILQIRLRGQLLVTGLGLETAGIGFNGVQQGYCVARWPSSTARWTPMQSKQLPLNMLD